MSSPGTLPLRKIPLTVRLVAVATLLADGCGGAVDVDEWEVVVVFKGSSNTTEDRLFLLLPLQLLDFPASPFLCDVKEVLESVFEMWLRLPNFDLNVVL